MSRNTPRGARWTAFRLLVIHRSGGVCERCGIHGRLEVHHIVELHCGGECYDLDNVEVLCRRCHIEHHHPRSMSTDRERRQWLRSLMHELH